MADLMNYYYSTNSFYLNAYINHCIFDQMRIRELLQNVIRN